MTLLKGFEFLFLFAGIAIAPAMILVCASLARIGVRRAGWMEADLLDAGIEQDGTHVENEPDLTLVSAVPSTGFGEAKVNLPMNCKDQAA